MKLSINKLKYFKSLHQRKFRQKYHNFIVEGAKMAEETLASGHFGVEEICAVPEWLEANGHLLTKYQDKITPVAPAELGKISLLSTPNQVFLVLRQPEYTLNELSFSQNLSLYLDDLQDPGNLGTILRIADWFGVEWVLLSKNCVEYFNPKVIQASMGAFLRVKGLECSFADLVEKFPELPRIGAVLDGENVFKTSLPASGILIIGNESKGIAAQVEQYLTHRISIPRHEHGGAESLNAAVATGIICSVLRNMPT